MSGIAMLICAVVNFPAGHALVCAGILRGSGKTASVAAYAFVSITILRPIMTAFFLFVMGWGLVGAWCALLLDQCIRASCATVLLHRLQKAGWNKMIENWRKYARCPSDGGFYRQIYLKYFLLPATKSRENILLLFPVL